MLLFKNNKNGTKINNISMNIFNSNNKEFSDFRNISNDLENNIITSDNYLSFLTLCINNR